MMKPLVVTMTFVVVVWLYASVNVAVQFTAALPVTVYVAVGPCASDVTIVAFPAQSSDSPKSPV